MRESTITPIRDCDFFSRTESYSDSSEGAGIGIPDVIGILRRRWRFLVVGCLTGFALGTAYILLATPLYTSTASVLIDTRMNQNLQTQKIVDDLPVDTSLVDSQVQILSSESIILPVIKSMDLSHDSEFVGPPDALGPQILWQIKRLLNWSKDAMGMKDGSNVDPEVVLERTAVATFLKHLKPKREDLTYVIDVAFESEDAARAAKIANAVADTYMAASLEARNQSTKMASQWLQNRLIELKVQATDADRELQKYKSKNNIIDTQRGLLDQQQLSDLNTQLIDAKTATAEAKARLERIQQLNSSGIPDATVTDALNNSVITRLRAQYLDIAARAADITSRVGEEHKAVSLLNKQMEELRNSIRSEERRIADAYESDYQIAKARENSLSLALSQQVDVAGTSSQAQVNMRDLESSAAAYRNLYNTFLQKFQETIQTQTIPVTDSRIVTRATTSLDKSSPKTVLALAGGLLLGLFIGSGVAVSREMTGNVFRTPGEVERSTGIRCLGILPIVSSNRNGPVAFGAKGRLRRLSRPKRRAPPVGAFAIEEVALESPHSRFTETLRNIIVMTLSYRRTEDIKVLGIVSSVAKEGKSVVAANLGALISGSGARTLIVDGDFHQRSLTALLAPGAKAGLVEALDDPSLLASIVHHRPRSRLDVLPCILSDRIPNAAEVLASPQMERLLIAARNSYDYIIIDLAPIVPVVDAKAMGRLIDRFIYVVEWGRTRQRLVVEALAESEIIRDRVSGIVLNKADPVALRSFEAYKGDAFKNYHLE